MSLSSRKKPYLTPPPPDLIIRMICTKKKKMLVFFKVTLLVYRTEIVVHTWVLIIQLCDFYVPTTSSSPAHYSNHHQRVYSSKFSASVDMYC